MMEIQKIFLELLAVLIAAISLIIAITTNIRAKRTEKIKELLSDKEFVGYGAMKLMDKGFPRKKGTEQNETITAILQACLFERSDRARAQLFAVIHENKKAYGQAFQKALKKIEATYVLMENYHFDKEQLDLKSGNLKISAIKKVLDRKEKN